MDYELYCDEKLIATFKVRSDADTCRDALEEEHEGYTFKVVDNLDG